MLNESDEEFEVSAEMREINCIIQNCCGSDYDRCDSCHYICHWVKRITYNDGNEDYKTCDVKDLDKCCRLCCLYYQDFVSDYRSRVECSLEFNLKKYIDYDVVLNLLNINQSDIDVNHPYYMQYSMHVFCQNFSIRQRELIIKRSMVYAMNKLEYYIPSVFKIVKERHATATNIDNWIYERFRREFFQIILKNIIIQSIYLAEFLKILYKERQNKKTIQSKKRFAQYNKLFESGYYFNEKQFDIIQRECDLETRKQKYKAKKIQIILTASTIQRIGRRSVFWDVPMDIIEMIFKKI
jgi:hypothetical protein